MRIEDFEIELKQLNADLTIQVNPHIPAMAGVYFKGKFLCACPAGQIFDEVHDGYGVEGFNGRMITHRTRPKVLQIVKDILVKMKDSDYLDALFGTGAYSDEKLGNPKKAI